MDNCNRLKNYNYLKQQFIMNHFKAYTINKDNHRSTYRFIPLYKPKYLHIEVLFTDSCLYNLNKEDNEDINKLYGFSRGHHHSESFRFGWKIGKNDTIDVFAYIYNKGNRIIKYLTNVKPDNFLNLTVCLTEHNYVCIINDHNMNYSTVKIPIDFKSNWTNSFGYKLFPYFGGNNKAPHHIHLFINDYDY